MKSSIENVLKTFSDVEIHSIRVELLEWYRKNRRKFPWRGDTLAGVEPPTPSAYGTWISEIMLQQTRTETVIPYWNRWMATYPTAQNLAAADIEQVNRLWAGLGYYRRAKQLLDGAKMIVAEFGSVVPDSVEQLLTVPGIGPYTAGAIASIAYGKSEALVDGNVIRVLSRLRAISTKMGPELNKQCWKLARDLVDIENAGEFNQGLMELGSVVCKPTNPDCDNCPLSSFCLARKMVETQEKLDDNESLLQVTNFPVKADKKKSKDMSFQVFLFYVKQVSGNLFLMVKRPDTGLLAGMWEFPNILLQLEGEAQVADPSSFFKDHLGLVIFGADDYTAKVRHSSKIKSAQQIKILDTIELEDPIVHIFSHQRHNMRVTLHEVELIGSHTESNNILGGSRKTQWINEVDMIDICVTTGVKKILNAAKKQMNRPEKDSALSNAHLKIGSVSSVSRKRNVTSQSSTTADITSFFVKKAKSK